MTTEPTPEQVLALPLPDNDAGAATVRDYFVALLARLWLENGGFSGKKPFGNSGWEYELYVPLIRAGMLPGKLDKNGYVIDFDGHLADNLILSAIKALGGAR